MRPTMICLAAQKMKRAGVGCANFGPEATREQPPLLQLLPHVYHRDIMSRLPGHILARMLPIGGEHIHTDQQHHTPKDRQDGYNRAGIMWMRRVIW